MHAWAFCVTGCGYTMCTFVCAYVSLARTIFLSIAIPKVTIARVLDLINSYNFNRSKKDKYPWRENISFFSAKYHFSFKNKLGIRKSKAMVWQIVRWCMQFEAVFKCANQFHPRVYLGFKPLVSHVPKEIFQTKVFWLTLNGLYLLSLSILSPFPCPVTYQSDVELRDLAWVEKNKNKMCWFPLKKSIEDWVISILHCCVFSLYSQILKICSKCLLDIMYLELRV